jgi:hypothetical protein
MMNKFVLILATLMLASGAQAGDIPSQLRDNLSSSILVLRQDYQLVDDDEGTIKNAPEKEYYGREYTAIARVGEGQFLVGLSGIKPWISAGLSKNDKFQPKVSATAYRSVKMSQYEYLDFDESAAEEVQTNRIFTIGGSEEPGLNVCGAQGLCNGYAAVIVTDDKSAPTTFSIEISPLTVTIKETTNIYNITLPNKNIIGGFFIVPIEQRPGLYDYSIAGQFQSFGGEWKLVTISECSPRFYTYNQQSNDFIRSTFSEMEGAVSDFISSIGL